MRSIGQIREEGDARHFSDFLLVQGIENQLEEAADAGWEIWIHSEEEIGRARTLLREFTADPRNPRFTGSAAEAARIRSRQEKENREFQRRIYTPEKLFTRTTGSGRLTLILIAVCVAVFLIQFLPQGARILDRLYIADGWYPKGNLLEKLSGLKEVGRGEIWRLFTPVLMHGGVLHLLFNMIWLRHLGSLVEVRISSRYFGLMAGLLAVFSNLSQYVVNGPAFLGMSGVVYGLFGYVWIRSKINPASGFYIDPTSVMIMFGWFIFCWLGFLPIANAAHTAGLAVGIVWGMLDAKRNR